MNEFEKAFETKREKKIYRIYRFKEFQTDKIYFLPLMHIVWAYDRVEEWCKAQVEWSDKRTHRILSYAFPKTAEVNKEKQRISRYIRSWGVYVKNWHVKWYDKYYCSKFNHKIIAYLLNDFEMDGFDKKVTVEDTEWTLVSFTKRG